MSRSRLLPKIEPLAPQLGKPFHRHGWVFEEKYDGWRIVAYKDGGSVRLSTVILDGEVCVLDKHLVSQFHLLDGPGDELATPPISHDGGMASGPNHSRDSAR